MKLYPVFLLLLLITGSVSADVSAPVSTDADTVDAQVELLRVAHEQWLHNVEFRSTYQVRKGFCSTEKLAKQGEIELPWLWSDDKPETAEGVFTKSRDHIRMSCRFPDPPLKVANWNLTRVPFDEVRSTTRNFNFHPSNQFQKSAILSTQEMDETALGSQYSPRVGSKERVSPISLYGGPPSTHFLESPQGSVARWDYSEPDSQRLQITMTAKSPGRNELRTIIFRRDLSCLALESIESVVERAGNPVPLVRAGYAQDFVECRGGPVARRVTQVLGGVSSPLAWIATVWQSNDLATPETFGNDFVVELEPNTLMTGLSHALPKDIATRVDLTRLDESAFQMSGPAPTSAEPLHSDKPKRWFFVINIAILAVIGLCIAVRRIRSQDVRQ